MRKQIIIIATSILVLVCGGLYYHLNVQARFEELQSQTLTGQLQQVIKEARDIEQSISGNKKDIEVITWQMEEDTKELQQLYQKSNQLKSLLSTGSKLSK